MKMRLINKKYNTVIIILILSFNIQASPHDPMVTLKLDVFAKNDKNQICDMFNRTDNVTICYKLTNTKGCDGNSDPDAISKEIIINTNINSDKLSIINPQEKIGIKHIIKNTPKSATIGDENEFQLEAKILRKPNISNPSDDCIINYIEVDTLGQLKVKLKYLHPYENDVVYFNYSTKISNESPLEGWVNCSGIEDGVVYPN